MPSSDSESGGTRVIQIANVSPQATRDQLYTMCSFLGRVVELKMYPLESNPNFTSYDRKVCYVRFEDSSSVAVAQHLTNTVFIDRALMCVPLADGVIPEEETALKQGVPGLSGQRKLPAGVVNQIQTMGNQQVIVTIDPNLSATGLPPYPPLPSNTDAARVEEIRRTVYVGGIPLDAEPQEVLDFLNERVGEVMYLRFAGDDTLPCRYAYVEFSQIASVAAALTASGQFEMKGVQLRFQHATQAVAKPTAKTAEAAQREVEEAMRKTNAAQPLISRAVDLDVGKSRSRSPRSSSGLHMRSGSRRSRSRSRHRSRSKSWGRYRRSWRSSGYSADTLIKDHLKDERKFDTGSRHRSRSRHGRNRSRSRSADRKRSRRSSRSRSRDNKESKEERTQTSKSSSSRSKKEEKRAVRDKTPERKAERLDERKKKKERDRKSRSRSRGDRKSHRSKKEKDQSPSAKRSKKEKKRRDSSEDQTEKKREKSGRSKVKREKKSRSKDLPKSPEKTATPKVDVKAEKPKRLSAEVAKVKVELEEEEEEKLQRSVTSPSPSPKKESKAKKYRKTSKSSSEDSDTDSSDTESE